MQIYLLRHGIAEDAQPGHSDADRALTGEGRDKLQRVLKRAEAAGVEIEELLSSPLKRAIETAEEAAGILRFRSKIVKTKALTPDASPVDVWEEIRARREIRSLLMASHEPLMSSTAAFLLDAPALQVDMKKAALLRIDCDRFGPQPRGVLKWMLTPGVCE
jgi:phosphohistidine phosphatase